MENCSPSEMHIIPLILIVVILVIILCTRSLVISQHHTEGQTGRSLSCQPERHEDEVEPLLSHVEDALQDDQLCSAQDTITHLTAEIARLKHVDSERIEEIGISHEGIAKLQQDLSNSISRNTELQRRCESLSRDLEGARLFLNTADTFSDSEVIQMLKKLNAELQHTSTFMAEHVLDAFKPVGATSDLEQEIVVDRASESIGSALVQLLRSRRHDESETPMYLQIAFQAHLAYHLYQIVSSWTLDEGHNAFIDEIYQRLRETEKQTISGRWRSLTHTHAVPTCVTEPDSLVPPILAGFSHILLVVGRAGSQSDIISGLSSMFEKKILSAVTLAGRLNQMIGEVVSGDFEVFAVRPGSMFHAGTMEDMDDSGYNTQGTTQVVLCASELGLMKRVQLGKGEREVTTVIKAKVVLESFLDIEN